MKVWKTLFIGCLALCLLLSFGVSTGFAEDQKDMGEAISTSETAERLYEIEELREKNSKTYQLSDGTCEYVGYAEDIHYEDADGNLKEINNAITTNPNKEGYTYSNTANSWYTYFADSLCEKNAVVLEKDGMKISFSMSNAKVQSQVAKSSALDKADSTYDEMLAEDNRAVVYKNALQNVDIAYTVRTSGLKEDIILRDASSPNVFEFDISTEGLSLAEREGEVFFVDDKGEDAFMLAPMFMEDANGKYSDKVAYTLEENGSGYKLTITADEQFLTATDTKYPVMIDPSVMVTGSSDTYDSCVDQQYPNSNYYTSPNLWTGGAYGTNAMRTFIKFNLPTNIHHDTITSAYLRIEKNAYAVPSIRAYRVLSYWSSSTIKWDNQPNYTTTYASGTAYNDSGYWYRMNIDDILLRWYNGTYTNYGFVLKEPYETSTVQKTRFYSSDAPSPHKPELIIVYDDTDMLDYWESNEDEIRRWTSTPSIYREKLNSNINFFFWTSESHARTEWGNANIPMATTTNESSADIKIYGGTYYELITETDVFDSSNLDSGIAGRCISNSSYEKDYYYNQDIKEGRTLNYANIAILDKGYSDDESKNIVTHELGHGFGWAGHASSSSNVMYALVNTVTTLTTIDKRHIQQVY